MGSVNKVILVGNLTRDPEMKQTEGKKPVCIIGVATNRNWTDEKGTNTKSRNITALLPLIDWLKCATGISQKGERFTLKDVYSPTPIPVRKG
jgi:single stranded DNA-binding protein